MHFEGVYIDETKEDRSSDLSLSANIWKKSIFEFMLFI